MSNSEHGFDFSRILQTVRDGIAMVLYFDPFRTPQTSGGGIIIMFSGGRYTCGTNIVFYCKSIKLNTNL